MRRDSSAEALAHIVKFFVNLIKWIGKEIGRVIALILNRKEVRERFAPIDYGERKEKRKRNYTRSPLVEEQIILRIKEFDTQFDVDKFKESVKEFILDFYNAYSKGDLAAVRGKVDINLFEQYQLMLKNNIENKIINKKEIQKVNFIEVASYEEDKENEILELAMNVIEVDYDLQLDTNEIIRGSNTIKERTTYILKIFRKAGTQTVKEEKELICPNCGAKVSNSKHICEYCKAVILTHAGQWILNNIERY